MHYMLTGHLSLPKITFQNEEKTYMCRTFIIVWLLSQLDVK